MSQNPEITIKEVTKSQLNSLSVNNGDMYFVTDTNEIYVDLHDKRQKYSNSLSTIEFPEGTGLKGQIPLANGNKELIFKDDIIGFNGEIPYSHTNQNTVDQSSELQDATTFFLTNLIQNSEYGEKINVTLKNNFKKDITISTIYCDNWGKRTGAGSIRTVPFGKAISFEQIVTYTVRLQVRFANYATITEDDALIIEKGLTLTSNKPVEILPYNKLNYKNLLSKTNAIGKDIDFNKNYKLPFYWINYLKGKNDSILNNILSIENNGITFQFFTDYHGTTNANNSNKIMKYIKEKYGINHIIFGGDILNAHTKELAVEYLRKFNEEYLEPLNIDYVFGNHEMNGRGIGESYNPSDRWLTKGESYSMVGRHNELLADTNKKFYYYTENTSQKIRFIYLDTETSPTYLANDTEQFNWFVNTLNSVKEGWHVVVFLHMFFNPTGNTPSAPLKETTNGYFVRTLCNAFSERIKQTDNELSWDFTNAKGNMACVVTGHCHRDYNINGYDYPIITTVCDAYYKDQNVYNNLDRTLGTVNEQAIDLFFVDTNKKIIKTIRLGAGFDRKFTFGTPK